MDAVITLVAPMEGAITSAILSDAAAAAGAMATPLWLRDDIAADLPVAANDLAGLRARLREALADQDIDIAVQPLAGRRKRLLLADMDSTLIGQECIDELGHALGIGDRIADITERAMRGELDFEAALRERVLLLKGLKEEVLEEVYRSRITLNPGGRTLVRTMKAHGATTRLVSGGFTFFADRVAEALGFDTATANRLVMESGALAGTVATPIFGREAKLAALNETALALGIPAADVTAIGDGANDLAMIEAAGLGVAYRAKPIVADRADARIDHADLTTLLYFQGYRHQEFVSD